MRKSIAIYVIPDGPKETGHAGYALQELQAVADNVLVVTGPTPNACTAEVLAQAPSDHITATQHEMISPLDGYLQGLSELRDHLDELDRIILTGAHVFGPIGGFDPRINQMGIGTGRQAFSAYPHNAAQDNSLNTRCDLAQLPSLDFVVFSGDLVQEAGFWNLWDNLPKKDANHALREAELALATYLDEQSVPVHYALPEGILQSIEPRYFEVDKLIKYSAPCFPASVFFLDPVLHDLNAIDLRAALDDLRETAPELYAHVIRFATRLVPSRDFNTIADQYEILSDHSPHNEKTEWDFGTVAVFIHAYYAEMMDEFWELIQQIPVKSHLFLTTASEENRVQIETYLSEKGLPQGSFLVRVVEQNRGRDMSSLFITFRDVILSDTYKVALRLHSKRTPQVAPQVGQSFKSYLFDNLVHNPSYVRNLLDMMEAEPDIGLVIPPVIHIGFATLGHSWFNNKKSLRKIADDLDLDVPLDADTPVAPYGTMYWFRTQALYKMFAWEWKWEDYNPEPHHIDGGLAHIQERLIGYCAQDAGYRTVSVMTPRHAGRNYAKLEYKKQLLASYLASGNILDQKLQMQHSKGGGRTSLFRGLRGTYGAVLSRYPWTRRFLSPIARRVRRILMPHTNH